MNTSHLTNIDERNSMNTLLQHLPPPTTAPSIMDLWRENEWAAGAIVNGCIVSVIVLGVFAAVVAADPAPERGSQRARQRRKVCGLLLVKSALCAVVCAVMVAVLGTSALTPVWVATFRPLLVAAAVVAACIGAVQSRRLTAVTGR